MGFITAIFVTFLLLCFSEIIWRRKTMHNELARKLVHISVGTFVAFWPFFLSWNNIRFLSLAFVAVVITSQYLQIFTAIHSVERPTWGEVLFALSVGLVTYITNDPYIYAAAILQMSIADGLAAVVGIRYGQTNRYRILGQYKSLMGSLAFLAASITILAWYVLASGTTINAGYVALLALGATLVENIGVRGFDNLLAPLLVAFVLTKLTHL